MRRYPLALFNYISLLEQCIAEKSVTGVQTIHGHLHKLAKINQDNQLTNTLLEAYCNCLPLHDSLLFFNHIKHKDIISWNTIISSHQRLGVPSKTLNLFCNMIETGIPPNQFTLSSIVRASVTLELFREVHGIVLRSGYHMDSFLATNIVDMYLKFGELESARQVFDKMPERNVVCWTTMMGGYNKYGNYNEALVLLRRMREEGVQPTYPTLVIALQVCSGLGHVKRGMEVHGEVVRNGYGKFVVVMSCLADMYVKCGCFEIAIAIFRAISEPDAVTLNMMINAYAQAGLVAEALKVFERMTHRDVFSWTSMISTYARNGFICEAIKLFNQIPHKNVISWNAMISGYAQNGYVEEALRLFSEMSERNQESWNIVTGCLVQSGRVGEAYELFSTMPWRSVLSWNTMLAGFAKNGMLEEAKVLYNNAPHKTTTTNNIMINGFMLKGLVKDAQRLFHSMSERDVITWTEMVSGYAHNGFCKEALETFNQMPYAPVSTWNAIIGGLSKNSHGNDAFELFLQMQVRGLTPDSVTFVSLLPVFANWATIERVPPVHANIVRTGFHSEHVVLSSLVDVYAKCGSIREAEILFLKISHPNVVSWTSMISGYALHGLVDKVFHSFERMKESGIVPNKITFISVLSSCSHSGLVDVGICYFNSMVNDYKITPSMEHNCCMVDLLGRAGLLDEAENFIKSMPMTPDASIWSCLLSYCTMHNNLRLAEKAAEHIFQLGGNDPGTYVLLSNMYAKTSKWEDVDRVRNVLKERGYECVNYSH